jgi:AraC-like DNA-binding protein
MTERTDAPILLRLAYQAMLKAGLPVEAILLQARVSPNWLDVESPERTPFAGQTMFWRALEDISGDPHIGLHLGEHLPVYRGQVLEYLISSSPTFGEGLHRALAYQRLLSDAITSRLVIDGNQCYLADIADATGMRHFAEALVMGVIRFFGSLTDGHFQPLAVHFTHVEGAPPDEYERVYGCPVTLGCSENRIYFDMRVLDHQVWHAEPSLLRLHEKMANEKLAELERLDLVEAVKRAIGEMLESGETTLEAVAQRIGMPARRLRTELEDAGTSFNHVLADYRSRLARRLLARTDESIEQIVYLTGFAEPSTFYRAFKRWTQETPIEYRKRKQLEA